MEEKFPTSFAFNPDPLSIFLIYGFNLSRCKPEPLRVADNCGDMTVGDMDQVSRVGEDLGNNGLELFLVLCV